MPNAIISRPTKTAMQSGRAKMKRWKLSFTSDDAMPIDPLMGWTGMKDTTKQIELYFDSEAAAIAYANKAGLSYEVVQPKTRAPILKAYADNFKYQA